jgi:hypothetical protein
MLREREGRSHSSSAVRYKVVLHISPYHLYDCGKIYSALCELEKRKYIELRLQASDDAVGLSYSDVGVWIVVEDEESGDTRQLYIDLFDRSDQFSLECLRHCDLYMKRSYHGQDTGVLPDFLKSKVVPFGLNHFCRSLRGAVRIMPALLNQYCREWTRHPSKMFDPEAAGLIDLKHYLLGSDPSSFELSPQAEKDQTVVYQPRLWSQEETEPDNAEALNEQRVELVRALRRGLGSRFRGGLVPNAYARKRYPDDVTDLPTKPKDYIEFSKKSLIGIYTRGIHHSLAFKMSEYLASSTCIVSEPLRNELPVPLTEGMNYLSFLDPFECVERCLQLLDDSNAAQKMRQNNHDYYINHVEPAAHMKTCLDRVFTSARVEHQNKDASVTWS